MTTFEFSIIEGILGRGGSAIGVKEQYTLRTPSEPEPTEVSEEATEVSEDPIPSPAEVPAEEPEPQPESEPAPEPEPAPESVVEDVVEEAVEEITIDPVEGEPALKVDGDVVVEEAVEPVVEEEPIEEALLQTTNIKFTFEPPSPFFGDKVGLSGFIEGLGTEPKYYLSVMRLVEGNGTEPVGEVNLTVDGERTVAQIRKSSQVPLSVSSSTLQEHLSQDLY